VDVTGDGFRATNYGMELPIELNLQIMGMGLVLELDLQIMWM
jgi:hypothetical protein